MAQVRPAWPITLVFGPKSSSPRTQRLRYHSAFPSRRRRPWTMPVPVNQWYVAGSTGRWGLGPLRSRRPSRPSGIVPVTSRSKAVTSSVTGPKLPAR